MALHSERRFHTIGDKSVAILGFNILAHDEKQRPRYLTVHGMLRDSSIEFLVSVRSAFHSQGVLRTCRLVRLAPSAFGRPFCTSSSLPKFQQDSICHTGVRSVWSFRRPERHP